MELVFLTCEQLAILLRGNPTEGAQATSRTQSVWPSSFSSHTQVSPSPLQTLTKLSPPPVTSRLVPDAPDLDYTYWTQEHIHTRVHLNHPQEGANKKYRWRRTFRGEKNYKGLTSIFLVTKFGSAPCMYAGVVMCMHIRILPTRNQFMTWKVFKCPSKFSSMPKK